MERLPNDLSFRPEEGGVTISLVDKGEEASYSALELVAMILSSAQVMLCDILDDDTEEVRCSWVGI